MPREILNIRNMVCNRCIKVVGDELRKLGIEPLSVELGKAELERHLNEVEMESVKKMLLDNGFQLIDDRKSIIIEKIRTLVIELVHNDKEKARHVNVSDFIEKEIGYDYSYLSNLFSSVEGIAIEKYIINQKIEKVKEWLVYDEMTLSEIADNLGYSSVQHLSSQFRKVTGLTPTHFKKIRENRRLSIDKI